MIQFQLAISNIIMKIFGFWQELLVFLISFLFFCLFQFNRQMPLFSGEDSFYHVAMARFIADHGIPQQFPYLNYTTLNSNFVDHQLLFHLILIPFIKLFGENAGAKIMDVLFVSLAFTLLFIIFRHYKLKFSTIYTLFILFTLPCDFYFRMSFIRVQSVALFMMTLSYFFILKDKWFALFITSFLFVWLYGGSVFIPVLVAIYLLAKILSGETINRKIIFSGICGFILGLIINPYFPKNITFLYSQIFQTGIGAKSYSGGEWRPYDTWYWVTISLIPVILFFGSLFLSLARNIKIDSKKMTLVIFSFFILLLQWKAKRFVEYWPFFASAAGIIMIGQYLEKFLLDIRKSNKFIWLPIMLSAFLVAICIKANIEIANAYHDTTTPINTATTKEVSDYLIKHSEPGQIVFTDDWDVFPFYFYFNQKNYYIVGLDPEFMNQYNHTLYEEFASISSGSDSNNLERIKNDFRASWILVGIDHPDFRNNLENNTTLFKKVFQNNDYLLYKVL